MKVYVAGKFQRLDEARAMMALLKDNGHEITHDWTYEGSDGLEGAALDAVLETSALRDLKGVRTADAIVLIHDDHCRGAFVEFGIAIALDKILVVVGECDDKWLKPIFYRLPTVKHVATPGEVPATLLRAGRAREDAAGARPRGPRAGR